MPIAYYASEPTRAFWDDHWAGQTMDAALRTAETSPLTAALDAALPANGRILEAGCGLGQYVVLFRRRGRAAYGVDWSLAALHRAHDAVPAMPLMVMDLGNLGFRAGTFSAYVSLGVVEHDPDGPDRILREAHRVLAPDGRLIISVPYVNGVRRVGAARIRRRHAERARAGAGFYQYAFGRREFRRQLELRGFRVIAARPYDPARLLRHWLGRPGWSRPGQPGRPSGSTDHLRRLVRRTLYTPPMLALLGHMILFVAVRVGERA